MLDPNHIELTSQLVVAVILIAAGISVARFVRIEIADRKRRAKRSALRQEARRRMIRMDSWSYELPWDLMPNSNKEKAS